MGSSDSDAVSVIIVGLLSSFASAILIALAFVALYLYRYSSFGRNWLDFLGRPGEFDDEQAFAKEEADALEVMDDMQRTEYMRAKGSLSPRSRPHLPSPSNLSSLPSLGCPN
jgi:hypothetical protein